MGRRATLTAGVALATFALAVAPASADHHLVMIGEVFPGQNGDADAEFVELKMHSPGQNLFGTGASVEMFGANGLLTEQIDLGSVPAGDSQRTLLVATGDAEDLFGVSADEGYAGDELDPDGGAVCYESAVFLPSPIDCVAWGAISAPPPGTGAPAAAIPDGSSLERAITRRCATWLESPDDTDSSAGDFFPRSEPAPQPNASVPAELACPNTFFIRRPQKKSKKRRPNFQFKSLPEDARFHCKLDGAPYVRCRSPYKPKVSRGRQTLRVLAQGELLAARYVWRVIR